MRIIALLLLAACGACTVSEPASAPPAAGAMWGTDAHVTPTAPDAVLRYADHSRGFAELRLPQGRGPFPLAVIFHGGCFKTGIADHAYMTPLATRWQEQGVASLNVDYREVGDGGGWPGSFADWRAAAKLIDAAARSYPIDRKRVTLVGHSAGALPALWLATPQARDGPTGKAAPVEARAAVVLDGPGDLGLERAAFDALCQFSAVGPFMGAEAQARFDAIAPAPVLEKVLFVQARLPAPPAASLAKVAGAGGAVAVRENPGASHFAIITPGHPAYSANEPAVLDVLKGR